MSKVGPLSEYYNYLQQTHQQLPEGTPVVTTPQQPVVAQPVTTQPVVTQPQQVPQVDTSNAMQSLANILVTPAEREAQERKLQENKRKMIAWTGLFDGLRQLGNLYAVSKGASPQQYTDKPYQAIEQSYQQERQLQDALQKYRQSYAQQLYNIQRQGEQDQMRREAQQAQIDYNKSRIKMQEEESKRKDEYTKARNKYYEALANKNYEQAEYWRLKADGVPAESAAKIAKDRAQAQKALSGGSSSGGRGRSRSSSGNDPYEELARQLDENPDGIGPILEQEGLGFYDKDTKKFTFTKNAPKGMVTTANKRAAGKKQPAKGGSLLPSNGKSTKKTKTGGSLLPK